MDIPSIRTCCFLILFEIWFVKKFFSHPVDVFHFGTLLFNISNTLTRELFEVEFYSSVEEDSVLVAWLPPEENEKEQIGISKRKTTSVLFLSPQFHLKYFPYHVVLAARSKYQSTKKPHDLRIFTLIFVFSIRYINKIYNNMKRCVILQMK